MATASMCPWTDCQTRFRWYGRLAVLLCSRRFCQHTTAGCPFSERAVRRTGAMVEVHGMASIRVSPGEQVLLRYHLRHRATLGHVLRLRIFHLASRPACRSITLRKAGIGTSSASQLPMPLDECGGLVPVHPEERTVAAPASLEFRASDPPAGRLGLAWRGR